MNAKRVLHSLLFVAIAATATLASAQNFPADPRDQATSAFPYTPVGSPNIE